MRLNLRSSCTIAALSLALMSTSVIAGGSMRPPADGAYSGGQSSAGEGASQGARGASTAGSGSSQAMQPMTVNLSELNGSGVSGTATLTPMGNRTKVAINLTGATGDHPAHIHDGTCANPDPKPKFGLENVKNGKSETTVDVSMADILAGQHLVNVHKSAQELSVYVACGDIKK